MTVTERILQATVVVIFRGQPPDRCVSLAAALYEGGFRGFEVTFNTDGAATAIEKLRARLPGDALVGAGTVLTPGEVTAAKDAGAQFVISPNVDDDVIATTRTAGLTSIPGAQTATEVLRARRAGADIVKIFPIRPLGADYLTQLRGPIADVPFMATGGVDAELARACLAAGANAVGTGIQLIVHPDTTDPDTITRGAGDFLAIARSGRPW